MNINKNFILTIQPDIRPIQHSVQPYNWNIEMSLLYLVGIQSTVCAIKTRLSNVHYK